LRFITFNINIKSDETQLQMTVYKTKNGEIKFEIDYKENFEKGYDIYLENEKNPEELKQLLEQLASEKSDKTKIIKDDLKAVKENGLMLKQVDNQTSEICLEAVKQNGKALQFVKMTSLTLTISQYYSICLEAVKQNGKAFKHVKKGIVTQSQYNQICLEAVKRNGNILEYIENQMMEVCLEAIKENPNALQYVKDQNAQICLEAIKLNYNVLKHIKDKILKELIEFKVSNT